MNSQFFLRIGTVLVLISISTCLASVWWSISEDELAPTHIGSQPADTPTDPPDTPTPIPDTASPTSEPPTSEPDPTIISSPTQPPTATRIPVSTRFTPTPVEQLLTGIITTDSGRLNVRSGPSINNSRITYLENGDSVIILQRTREGDWLQIKTVDQVVGWVSEQYVEVQGGIQAIPVANNLAPTPTNMPTQEQTTGLPTLINVYSGTYFGNISPFEDKWYTFFEGEEPGSILLVLMFDPNVNLKAEATNFFIYDEQAIPVWPPEYPNQIPNIGAGSRPASDRDGDAGNGELIWQGGPLQRNRLYYLRIINNSTSVLQYCLVTRDIYEWSCPR